MPPTGRIRVAICQLQSHPALLVDTLNYLKEPFVPEDRSHSLATQAKRVVPAVEVQDHCLDSYLAWQHRRLKAVLDHISAIRPFPDLLVFPEGAVPFSSLPRLKRFAEETQTIVFAGTHSVPLNKNTAKELKELGARKSFFDKLHDVRATYPTVLPVFTPERSEFLLKQASSVFELNELSRASPTVELKPLRVKGRGALLNVLPAICAEAIQNPQITGRYDLTVVLAYSKPDAFTPFIETHVRNAIPCLLANDGRFGGSGIFLPVDRRMGTWWWSPSIGGRLPPGDGILVVEIDWAALAPQVGVAKPERAATLVRIAAIAYEDDPPGPYAIARDLPDVASISDQQTQHHRLGELLDSAPTALQEVKLSHLTQLAREGLVPADWWPVLGTDCQVPGTGGIFALEHDLARHCLQILQPELLAGSSGSNADLASLTHFLRACTAHVDGQQAAPSTPPARSALIDRQTELARFREFFGDRAHICALIGLRSIGKTSLLDAALEQGGYRRIIRIRCEKDVTPEFLAATILAQLRVPIPKDLPDPVAFLCALAEERIRPGMVHVIEDAHHLSAHTFWRDPAFPRMITRLAALCEVQGAKLVIESEVNLDLDLADPGRLIRIRLNGLPGQDGLALLDQQLRRASLDPALYSSDQRKDIVSALDGHPGALILAAEYVEKAGIDRVLEDLRSRKGVFSAIVRRIVQGLTLDRDERDLLGLLGLANAPIPMTVLHDVVQFDVPASITRLWNMALIERRNLDHIEVSPLLRGFADLPPVLPEQADVFHEAAARRLSALAARAGSGGAQQLHWAAQARFHALCAHREDLSPDLGPLADGALGAVRALLEKRDYERAKPLIDAILRGVKRAEYLELAAQVYARLGLLEDALTLAKDAASLQAERTWILTEIGRLALHVHRTDIATEAVRIARLGARNPSEVDVLEGKICLKKGDVPAAIVAFEQATVSARNDGWPFFYLGRELLKHGRVDDAIRVLHEGEEHESRRSRTRRNVRAAIRTQLGLAYIMAQDAPNAERWLSMVASHDPGNVEVVRAFAFLRALKNEEGIVERAIKELDPNKAGDRHGRAQVHLYRALFYLAARMKDRASEEFSEAASADPRNVFVLLRWAETLVEMARDADAEGDAEAARFCAERAKEVASRVLKYVPTNPAVLALLEKLSDDFNVH